MGDSCAPTVHEIKEWFDTIPQGFAELRMLDTAPDGERVLELVPLRNLAAAHVRIEIGADTFAVRAGQRFLAPGRSCSAESPTAYCQAIVAGKLTETALLRKGEAIGWKTELLVGTKRLVGRRLFGHADERWYDGPLRWFRRGRGKRRVGYSPYYEMIPLASDWSISAPIKPPIFCTDGFEVFLSVADAQSYVEPYDVDDGVWYDSDGRLLRMLDSDPRKEFWVKLLCVDSEPGHADELRRLMTYNLSYLGRSTEWLSGASLEQLVAESLQYAHPAIPQRPERVPADRSGPAPPQGVQPRPSFRIEVQDTLGLTRAVIELLGPGARLSLEDFPREYEAEVRSVPGASSRPDPPLVRGTIFPRSNFWILPIEAETKEDVLALLSSPNLIDEVMHLHIEKDGALQLEAYDMFQSDSTYTGSQVPEKFLRSLVKRGILRGYTPNA